MLFCVKPSVATFFSITGSDVFSKESCDDGCDVESNRIKLKVRFGASHIACPTCHDCWTDPEFECEGYYLESICFALPW